MLITGSEGFIGRALMDKSEGDNLGFDLVRGNDIRIPKDIDRAVKVSNAKVIVNLAAISGVMDCYNNPVEAALTNVTGAVNVLEAARANGAEKVILASSGAVRSVSSPYAASKASMESFGASFAMAYGLGVTSLRFTNIYGEGAIDKTSVVAQFCKQALTTGRIIVNGDGEQTRDFVYLGDVVEAIEVVAQTPQAMTPPVIQVCGNNQISINQIASMINEMIGGVETVHTDKRIGDVRSNIVERDYFTLSGNTRIEDGIKKTVDYFVSIKDEIDAAQRWRHEKQKGNRR